MKTKALVVKISIGNELNQPSLIQKNKLCLILITLASKATFQNSLQIAVTLALIHASVVSLNAKQLAKFSLHSLNRPSRIKAIS